MQKLRFSSFSLNFGPLKLPIEHLFFMVNPFPGQTKRGGRFESEKISNGLVLLAKNSQTVLNFVDTQPYGPEIHTKIQCVAESARK